MADQALQIAISLDRRQITSDLAALRQQLAAVKVSTAVEIDAKAARSAIDSLQSQLKTIKPVSVPVSLDANTFKSSLTSLQRELAAIKPVSVPIAAQTAAKTQRQSQDNGLAALKAASAEKQSLIKTEAAKEIALTRAASAEKIAIIQAQADRDLLITKQVGAERLSAQKAQQQKELAAIRSAADEQSKAAKDSAENFSRAAQVVGGLGIGAAFAGVAKESLLVANAFDSARAKAATLTPNVDGLVTALQSARVELNGQATTTELLAASYDALSAGFTNNAEAATVAAASSRLAVGGFTDTSTALDGLTSTLNAYGLSAASANEVADKFITTQNLGKITVDEYAQQIGKVAPLAAQAGISLDELNGFIAQATVKGVQAESAFSGYRQAIAATLKPSSEAAKLAKELGIAFNADALKNGGIVGILEQLNKQGKDTPDVLIKLFGSVEAVAAIAPSAGEGLNGLRSAIDQLGNSAGASKTAFDTISNSFEGRATAASKEFQETLVLIGQTVQAIASPVLALASGALGAFNALPAPIKAVAAGATVLASGVVVATAALVAFEAAQASAAVTAVREAAATKLSIAGKALYGIVTSANAAATTALTFSINTNTISQDINTLKTLAGAKAKEIWALATGKASLAALKFVGTLALAVAAVAAVQAAFKRTEGAKFASEVDKSSEAIRKLNEQAKKPIQIKVSVNTEGGGSNALGNIAANFTAAGGGLQGTLAAVQSGFIETYNAAVRLIPGVDGLTNSTDRYGGSLVVAGNQLSIFGREIGVVTAAQRGAQAATLALEEQQKQVEARLTAGQDVLNQYGLAVVDSNDRARLSFNGQKDAAVSAIQAQITANNAALQSIKASKAPNEEAAALQKAQIANIERQNNLLKQRVAFLNADTDAQAKNTKVGREGAAINADIEKLTGSQVPSSPLAQGELVKLQMIYDAESGVVASGDAEKDAAAAQARIAEIEINAAKDLIAKLEPLLREKQQAAIGDPAQLVEAENIEANLIRAKTELINKERTARKKKDDEAKKASQEEIKRQEQLIANERARIQLNATKATNQAKTTFLRDRRVDADEAGENLESAKLDIEAKSIQQEEGLRNQELALIQRQEAAKLLTREEAAGKRLQIEQKAADAQGKLLDIQQQREDLALKRRLRRLEEASAKELAAAKLTSTQSGNEQKRARLAGTATDSEGVTIAAELQLSQKTLAIKQKELTEIKALEAEGLLSKKESAKRQVEIAQAIADQEGQILDLQLKQREQAITKAATAANLALETEVQARQSVSNAIQQQIDLLNAQASTQKAASEAAISAIENQLKVTSAAAELQKTASSSESSAAEKDLARTQLTELGFSADASALDILREQQILEDKQAAAKAAALSNELALTTQIQQITSQKAITEAKIAELKAKQAAIDAAANLERAKLSGDQNAVLAAELQNQAAQQGVALAAEQVSLTQNQAAAEQRVSEIRAQSQLDAARTDELLREQAQSTALLAAGGAPQSNQRSQAADILRNTNVLPPAAPSPLVPDSGNLGGALKSANGGIESKLDQLNSNILTLANSPRSISVSSPQPVEDLTKIMGDLQSKKSLGKL